MSERPDLEAIRAQRDFYRRMVERHQAGEIGDREHLTARSLFAGDAYEAIPALLDYIAVLEGEKDV